MQCHALFSVLIIFCCCSCFHLSCFLFNFESSRLALNVCVCVCVCPITSTQGHVHPVVSIRSLFILFAWMFSFHSLLPLIPLFPRLPGSGHLLLFIIASALLASQLFYWTFPVPALNVGGLWIHFRANLQFLYKHSIESAMTPALGAHTRTNTSHLQHKLIWGDCRIKEEVHMQLLWDNSVCSKLFLSNWVKDSCRW